MGHTLSRPTGPTGGTQYRAGSPASYAPAIIDQVETLLKEGQDAEAIRVGYLRLEDDVRRAFGMKLPNQWTHREFLSRYLRRDMGYITTLLPRLHALFEPVRYGDGQNATGATLLPLLRSAYQEPALRTLSLLPTAAPSSPIRSGAPLRKPPGAKDAGGVAR